METIIVALIFILVGCLAFFKGRINLENTDIHFSGTTSRIIGLILFGIGIGLLIFILNHA